MNEQVLITNRIDPCRCGCKGSDPWHAREFQRVLRDVRHCFETVKPRWLGGKAVAIRKAEARFPFGVETVYETVILMEGSKRAGSSSWFPCGWTRVSD